MGSYDQRDGPGLRPLPPHERAYAANEYILAWWEHRHDEAIADSIRKRQWHWDTAIIESLVGNTPNEVTDRWRSADPLCTQYAWRGVLLGFARARAEELGLTAQIRQPRRRDCPLCGLAFDEDSVPWPLTKQLGIDHIDFCAPCLKTRLFWKPRRLDSSRDTILRWTAELAAVIQRAPPQFFGERAGDLLGLSTEQRLRVFRLLESAPSTLSVEREFGTWRSVLVQVGLARPVARERKRARALPADDGRPSADQLGAFLKLIDEPPSPWAEDWFTVPPGSPVDMDPGIYRVLYDALVEAGEDPRTVLGESASVPPDQVPAREETISATLAEWRTDLGHRLLRSLVDEGGSANFIIVSDGDIYVQATSCRGYTECLVEAVSNNNLPPERHLNTQQTAVLNRHGFVLDSGDANFAMETTPADAARVFAVILEDVYEVAESAKLTIELHLGDP